MGCVKETKKVLKRIWAEVTPALIQYAVGAVRMFDDLRLSSSEKREAVVTLIQLRENVTERLARLVLEYALNAVRMDGVDDSALGQDDGVDAAIE